MRSRINGVVGLKATTFLPCCLIIPRLSRRHGMRPLRRGFPKSMAATHSRVARCAPRLPRPEPDSRDANAQGEKGRAEALPWEEEQRFYQQPLENALICGVLWWLCMSKVSRNTGDALPALHVGSRWRHSYS